MPKSKRARPVHTSAVAKKPSKEKSASLFSAVRAALDTYQNVFVFSVENMRNTYLKEIRQQFQDSRIFFGKTKVMAKALGAREEDEYMPGLAGLSRYLRGTVGLLCSNRPVAEVQEFFEEYVETDFARAGTVATRTFTIPAGIVCSTGGSQPTEDDVPLPHSLEAQVRKWGMPTRLEKGRVMLDQEFVVCEEGKVLNSNQTALLKTFGVAIADFKVKIEAYWQAATGEVTVVEGVDGDEDDESMEEG
jgi:mRNA turnover protein 4